MKKINFIVALILVTVAQACKEDAPQLSLQEKQIQLLRGKWQLASATRDAVAIEGYEDFELVFSSSNTMLTYISLNRPSFSPWEAGGVLVFGGNPVQELVRDAGTDQETFLNYTVSENALVISFAYQGEGFENSRTLAVQGNWEFTFVK